MDVILEDMETPSLGKIQKISATKRNDYQIFILITLIFHYLTLINNGFLEYQIYLKILKAKYVKLKGFRNKITL